MELFKVLLFGVTGLSLVFWVCVIALWHTYMFPKFFAEDSIDRPIAISQQSSTALNLISRLLILLFIIRF